jgi:excinuclease ABC subunit A
LEIIGEKYGFKLTDAVNTIPEEAMEMILNGKKKFTINSKDLGVAEYKIDFEGISHFIKNQHDERFNKHKTLGQNLWTK